MDLYDLFVTEGASLGSNWEAMSYYEQSVSYDKGEDSTYYE